MTENNISEDRAERLSFHLSTGDYFPMLATILGFVQESVQDCACSADNELVPLETDVLRGTRDDLMYLHKNYRIVPINQDT
jgi:hypothetical protein